MKTRCCKTFRDGDAKGTASRGALFVRNAGVAFSSQCAKNSDVNLKYNNHQGASLAPLQSNVVDVSRQRKPRSLSSFIGGFKSSVTKRIKIFCPQPNPPIWQRNYYESIVGDEQQLARIRQYILNNPQKWEEDPENSQTDSQELLIDFIF